MLDKLFDFVTSDNKLYTFVVSFLVVAAIACILHMTLMTPIALILGTFSPLSIISGGVGCGIGTAIVCATILTFNS